MVVGGLHDFRFKLTEVLPEDFAGEPVVFDPQHAMINGFEQIKLQRILRSVLGFNAVDDESTSTVDEMTVNESGE